MIYDQSRSYWTYTSFILNRASLTKRFPHYIIIDRTLEKNIEYIWRLAIPYESLNDSFITFFTINRKEQVL